MALHSPFASSEIAAGNETWYQTAIRRAESKYVTHQLILMLAGVGTIVLFNAGKRKK